MHGTRTPAGAIFHLIFISLLFLISSVSAYQVSISEKDYLRQTCSGMWAADNTYINVTFDKNSQGQLAMIIYEWSDVQYLGKEAPEDTFLTIPKTYVCTSDAQAQGYCTREQLGYFILDLPNGKSINDTSFWSARVFLSPKTEPSARAYLSIDDTETATKPAPWKRDPETINPSPEGPLKYSEPIHYIVKQAGYYCVVAVPMSGNSIATRADTDVPLHPSYNGDILFKNSFEGKLEATDYPKVNFYLAMSVLYIIFGLAWGWLCYRHSRDILPLQNYLSGLVGLLIIEMVANWAYYRYLNAHGRSTASTVFLIVVSILDAGKASMSFFMLLVVAMGLSVVKESLGKTMIKCQVLAAGHFIFGILYSVGIVELSFESTASWVLLLFIVPLAMTLSLFLLWIMHSLNATIMHLRDRKQHYKLKMFQRLHFILIFVTFVLFVFFIISSFAFSGRLAEDFEAKSWRYRWWLLDGYLALLYLVAFGAIAWLWRPTDNNRQLAMFEELAQDEEAGDYDLETLNHRQRDEDDEDDNITLVGNRDGGRTRSVAEDVVFEIGDDEEDEDPSKKPHRSNRLSGENAHHPDERQGLMNRDN